VHSSIEGKVSIEKRRQRDREGKRERGEREREGGEKERQREER
jgi:hypothetical protein